MALLVRINIISKKLTNFCFLSTQTFGRKASLPPFACRHRNFFTNSCSIYFSKKKIDEVKTPRCPDFEQFFTKAKKSETNKNGETQLGKSSDEKPKPPFSQPSIFDDKSSVKPSPRPVFEKKPSPMPSLQTSKVDDKPLPNNSNKNETKPQISDDKVLIKTDKPPATDKKYTPTKPLDEFKQFALMPQAWGSKTPTEKLAQTQQKETVSSQQSQTIKDSKAKQDNSENSKPQTDKENNKNTRKMHLWLAGAAAAAAALLATTLVRIFTNGAYL